MKTNISLSRVIGAAIIAVSLVAVNVRSEDTTDAINLVRSIYKTDRQAFITEHMPLTATESANFWPLYREYRQDMEKLGDSLVKLVLEFADTYPDIPDKDAQRLLKDYMALEKEHGAKQAHYFKKAGKILPASKVLRWAQLENRMDLTLRLQLASTIPIVPVAQQKPSNP